MMIENVDNRRHDAGDLSPMADAGGGGAASARYWLTITASCAAPWPLGNRSSVRP